MKASPRSSSATTAPKWSTGSPIRCSPAFTEAKPPDLSVRAVLPRFAEMERTHGSLGRAMLAARKKMPQPAISRRRRSSPRSRMACSSLVETLCPN